MNHPKLLSLAVIAIGLAGASLGCATPTPYWYRPATPALTDTEGYATGVYPVPPERPEGEVRVLSFGVVELEANPGTGKFPTLHTRFIIANNGGVAPFTLDTREVLLDVPGEGDAAALYANTDAGTMPRVAIARGERRVIDFYFPVPAGVQPGQGLPSFDLRWRIETEARIVAERTPFQRYEVAPPPRTEVTVVAGWGPFWWLHPYRRHHFVHPPVLLLPRPPHRVVVTRPHAHVRPRGR